jgi:hypothetical protein
MKYFLITLLTCFALNASAVNVKKPCKEGQTEADGCRVSKKAEKKKPAEKPATKKSNAKKSNPKDKNSKK